MHTSFPLLIKVLKYFKFDTGHGNREILIEYSQLGLDPNAAFSEKVMWDIPVLSGFYLAYTVHSAFRICIPIRLFKGLPFPVFGSLWCHGSEGRNAHLIKKIKKKGKNTGSPPSPVQYFIKLLLPICCLNRLFFF